MTYHAWTACSCIYRTEINSTADSIDTIAIEDAIDPEYLDAIKTYTKEFFDEHEEVESMKLWELVCFNNLPEGHECEIF